LPWPGGDRFASLKTAHDIGVIPGSVVVRVAPHRFIEESAQAVGGGSKYGCSHLKSQAALTTSISATPITLGWALRMRSNQVVPHLYWPIINTSCNRRVVIRPNSIRFGDCLFSAPLVNPIVDGLVP